MTSVTGVNGHRWQKIRAAALRRDRYCCVICGSDDQVEVDHITPRWMGGTDDLQNLRCVCHDHHVRITNASNQTRRMKTSTSTSKIVPLLSAQNPALALLRSPHGTTSHGNLTGHEDPGAPRFFPEPSPDAVGTRAGEVLDHARTVLREPLLPWQEMVLDRMLEIDADGRWCRSTWVLICSRQSGKSTLLRALASWLASVEGQVVLTCSSKLQSTQHLMRPEQLRIRSLPGHRATYSKEQPEADYQGWDEYSRRWIGQAGNSAFGRSFSADTILVDEAQDVPVEALEAASPTQTERSNPLTVVTGTGTRIDSQALLMEQRSIAMAGGSLIEWSAEPGSDWLSEDVWRQASPRWTPSRLRRMREDVRSKGEMYVKTEFLCQNIAAHGSEPWIDLDRWDAARADLDIPEVCDIAAVEDVRDGVGGSLALAWSEDRRVHVVGMILPSMAEAWRLAARSDHVVCGLTLRNEPQAIELRAKPVGRRETSSALPELRRLLSVDGLRWDGDDLDLQVRSAQVREDAQGALIVAANAPSGVLRAAAWAVQSVRISREPVLV